MNHNPPDTLYHYTSQEGLIGIVHDKKIWATEIRFLNDSQEFRLGIEFIGQAITEIHNDSSYFKYRPLLDGIDVRLKELGAQLINPAHHTIYVSSFSGHGDLLSQWRGYCPGANGYSLGFDFKMLKSLEKRYGITLSQCLYEKSEQLAKVKELLETAYKCFDSLRKKLPQAKQQDCLESAVLSFVDDLLESAPSFKDQSFKAENEWRLTKYAPLGSCPLRFRSGKSIVIPFIEFPLTDQKGHLPLDFCSDIK